MNARPAKKNLLKWLISPPIIFLSVCTGVTIGIYNKPLAYFLAPAGDIYLALLEMCVLPLMVTAIISGLGRLFSPQAPRIPPVRLLIVFLAGLMLASAVGLSVGLLVKPGSGLNQKDREVLGRQLQADFFSDTSLESKKSPSSLLPMLMQMVPRNIVAAMSLGPNLGVLFFSILFGTALGLMQTPAAQAVLLVMEGIYGVFLKIIFSVLYGLPFGLIGLFANQIAQTGPDILQVLLRLIVACALGSLFLVIIYALAIWWRVRGSFATIFLKFQQTLVIALTSSAFATIPTALSTLQNDFKLPNDTTNLIYPLGINLNRHGSVFQFALAGVFMMQLYDIPIHPEHVIITWIGSIFAGMAALAGLPGLSMLAIVIQLLNLPSQVAIVLISSIDTILLPMLVLLTVFANCVLTILVCHKPQSLESPAAHVSEK
ncbi:MAG: dicarboxylate/amino acid:cation symporter [Magnetococcus sp. DMHC-6]